VNICSAAGTGDVLKVQKLLHHCEDHFEKKESDKEGDEDKKDEKEIDDTFQGFAVIGIALIAMGEDIGAEMSLRQFNHLVCDAGAYRSGHSLKNRDTCRCTMVNLRFGKPSP
jgi:26S proteasome regulatory subunit N1